MPTLIETLVGDPARRQDDKRLLPIRRPLPERPRDLLELLVALGTQASMKSLLQTADLRQGEPRALTFVALSRWMTPEELDKLPATFVPHHFLHALLVGREFREHLFRRICDAFPERRRMFFIRLPRCAGTHFLHKAGIMNPVFPPDLPTWRRRDEAEFIPALGRYLGQFILTRTILAVVPNPAPCTGSIAPAAAATPLPWALNTPPYRLGDRLFAIIREPASLILSLVNAITAHLRAVPVSDQSEDDLACWRTRLGPLPAADALADWKQVALRILAELPLRNPLCTGLGDGTAAGTLLACRLWNIELADLSRYPEWLKYTWDTDPEEPINPSPAILTASELTSSACDTLIGQDLEFYAQIRAKIVELGPLETAIWGKTL